MPEKPLLPAQRMKREEELAEQEALARRSIFDEMRDDVEGQIGFHSRTYGPGEACRSHHFTSNVKFTRWAKKHRDDY